MAVVARLLTPEDFGIFAVAVTVQAIVGSIAELGVASCLIRGDVDPDEIGPTVATVSLASSSVLAALMAIFAVPIASALGSAEAAGPTRVMAIAVFLVGVFAVPGAELARNFRQDKQFWANLIGFVPSNVLLILLAIHGSGAMAFAWSRVAAQALTGLAMTCMASRLYWPGLSRRQLRYVLGFGLPLAGANLLNYVLLNTDYAFIGHLLGPVELGTYMLAYNVSSWSGSLLNSMLNVVAMPAFSRVKHDASRLQGALVRATTVLALVALPICGLTMALAGPLILTVYGNQWSAAAPVLSILAIYGAISILCLLFANVLSGLGNTRALLLALVPWLGALVPAMAIGVRTGGITGAAIAHVVVIAVVTVPVYLTLLKRVSPVRILPILRAVAPIAAVTAATACVAFGASHLPSRPLLQLLLGGVAGAAVYLLGVLPMAERLVGPRVFDRLPKVLRKPAQVYVRTLRNATPRRRPRSGVGPAHAASGGSRVRAVELVSADTED
jgi:PST family polysaccharide transporter